MLNFSSALLTRPSWRVIILSNNIVCSVALPLRAINTPLLEGHESIGTPIYRSPACTRGDSVVGLWCE